MKLTFLELQNKYTGPELLDYVLSPEFSSSSVHSLKEPLVVVAHGKDAKGRRVRYPRVLVGSVSELATWATGVYVNHMQHMGGDPAVNPTTSKLSADEWRNLTEEIGLLALAIRREQCENVALVGAASAHVVVPRTTGGLEQVGQDVLGTGWVRPTQATEGRELGFKGKLALKSGVGLLTGDAVTGLVASAAIGNHLERHLTQRTQKQASKYMVQDPTSKRWRNMNVNDSALGVEGVLKELLGYPDEEAKWKSVATPTSPTTDDLDPRLERELAATFFGGENPGEDPIEGSNFAPMTLKMPDDTRVVGFALKESRGLKFPKETFFGVAEDVLVALHLRYRLLSQEDIVGQLLHLRLHPNSETANRSFLPIKTP